MAKCEVCGNDDAGRFEVNIAGETHVFDGLECAIHALVPRCTECGAPEPRMLQC